MHARMHARTQVSPAVCSKASQSKSSNFHGVSWHKRDRIWLAYAREGYLGYFRDETSAAKKVDAHNRQHGRTDKLNFPSGCTDASEDKEDRASLPIEGDNSSDNCDNNLERDGEDESKLETQKDRDGERSDPHAPLEQLMMRRGRTPTDRCGTIGQCACYVLLWHITFVLLCQMPICT